MFSSLDIFQEREWFQANFGPNPFDDYEAVKSLCEQYREEPQNSSANSAPLPARESGSVSSAYPLNKPDDAAVTWTAGSRNGVCLKEDELFK